MKGLAAIPAITRAHFHFSFYDSGSQIFEFQQY